MAKRATLQGEIELYEYARIATTGACRGTLAKRAGPTARRLSVHERVPRIAGATNVRATSVVVSTTNAATTAAKRRQKSEAVVSTAAATKPAPTTTITR